MTSLTHLGQFVHGVSLRHASIVDCLRAMPDHQSAWLSAVELSELQRINDVGRRNQWLAGRWVSKQLIADATIVDDLRELHILTRDQRFRGVRPEMSLFGRRLDWSLSIAHTSTTVLAALAPTSQVSLGIDLTDTVRMSDGFERLWHAPAERRWLAGDRPRRGAALWAIKEVVYKAANLGESWDPRQIRVVPLAGGQFSASYRGRSLGRLDLKLWTIGECLAAAVCLPRPIFGAAVNEQERLCSVWLSQQRSEGISCS